MIGRDSAELERQFRESDVKARIFASIAELVSVVPQNGSVPQTGLAIWFCSIAKQDEEAGR